VATFWGLKKSAVFAEGSAWPKNMKNGVFYPLRPQASISLAPDSSPFDGLAIRSITSEKDIFYIKPLSTRTAGLVQQTVQIVARFAHTI
jgi:hypothetical protein